MCDNFFFDMKKEKVANMTILSLTTTYPESNNPTKAKFVHLINKELVDLGCKVHVVTPSIVGSKQYEQLEGVFVKRFRYFLKNKEDMHVGIAETLKHSKFQIFKIILLVIRFTISSFLTCIKHRPSVIHAHWAIPCAQIGLFLSFLFRTKLFVTVYGVEFSMLNGSFKFLKPIVRWSLNKTEKVIAIANYGKDNLIKLGVDRDKILIINPVPNFGTNLYSKVKVDEFRNTITDKNKKIILFVGRLIERKGVEYLINSMSFLPKEKVHLIIAGGGPLLSQLQKLAQKLDINNITFFESPDDYEVGLLYKIADVFVLPSINDSRGDAEGLGLVMVEAMNNGIPVIATKCGGIVDVIQDKKNGLLINQKDPKTIAKSIELILTDEDWVKKLIQGGRITVKEYSPANLSKKYLEMFLGY